MDRTFEKYLADAEQKGVIDFNLRITRTPEGMLDFYIHPAGQDGETGDFSVSGSFVSRLDHGAGSSRPVMRPLLGSDPA